MLLKLFFMLDISEKSSGRTYLKIETMSKRVDRTLEVMSDRGYV